MAEEPRPSTTPAAAAVAETREQGAAPPPDAQRPAPIPGEHVDYTIGDGVTRAVEGRPYERKRDDPLYRPLRIYALDPAVSMVEGSIATVNVPYEPLEPGFKGSVFEVDAADGGNGEVYQSIDLDDHKVLLAQGRNPSPADPLFHQQMVYAVCSLVYAAFRVALGRDLAWGFKSQGSADRDRRLRLRPYAMEEENAYYDEESGELAFGYFRARGPVYGNNLRRGLIFTSLSHDVVAHELTHALLDGLRAHFMVPSGPDVLAFHEAFGDLIAIFQHFSYDKVVQAALARARGNVEQAPTLVEMAKQFGQTVGDEHSLRTAIDLDPKTPKRYDAKLEEHELGSVLVSAVFDAFLTIFRRKTAQYFRLASRGSGVLPPGELPADLQMLLARKASQLAAQFQSICIRAIDYCPPVDIELGEYLRAAITADHDLVPDDKWSYREAWADAFRSRGIIPRGVDFLAEDALLWRSPRKTIAAVKDLTFGEMKFAGDPARPASADELRRQAGALGRVVTHSDYIESLGLVRAGDARLGRDTVDVPKVQSIRSSRRVGPDGQVVFDLIAEVTQKRTLAPGTKEPGFDFYGGTTLVIGPDGIIRYTISKSVLQDERLERQRDFMASERGRRAWVKKGRTLVPSPGAIRALHARRTKRGPAKPPD